MCINTVFFSSLKLLNNKLTMTSITIALFLFLVSICHIVITTAQPRGLWRPTGGEWTVLQESIGVSAMHMQLLHDNNVIIFDRTDFGPSNLRLSGGRCRQDPADVVLKVDCTAHSVLFNPRDSTFRPLFLQTDTWCSSGAVLSDGTVFQSGGYNDGEMAVRTYKPCDTNTCDWVESHGYLTRPRWYATNQLLPDGRVIIIGGRQQFNYEFYPKFFEDAPSQSSSYSFDFLRLTMDDSENNLYPFVHLLPDGNLFVFANTRSILFDYNQNRVLKEFPMIPGGDPRNYPSSGSSVLLPLDENRPNEAEVIVCGGAPRGAFADALRGIFAPSISTCGRLRVTDQNPVWEMETMPMGRVMSDMLILPDGNLIIINGASAGVSGWDSARGPVTRPLIYHPTARGIRRFALMNPSTRPRMYHSTAIVLGDSRVLVGGSNPNHYYNFSQVLFPTDLSVETFSPPYLSTQNDAIRPRIVGVDTNLAYNTVFEIRFTVPRLVSLDYISVRMMAPSFTTHSFSMNQRMVQLVVSRAENIQGDQYNLVVIAPSKPEIAPPGYYMLFVVHTRIPSSAVWVSIG